jgi:hypothetical protein
MILSSTQTLTEMNNRNISFTGKGECSLQLLKLVHSFADKLEVWETQNCVNLMTFLGIARIALPLSLPCNVDSS